MVIVLVFNIERCLFQFMILFDFGNYRYEESMFKRCGEKVSDTTASSGNSRRARLGKPTRNTQCELARY